MDPDFRALYGVAYPRLVRGLTVACGDQGAAEDAVQEAFTQLVPRWERVRHYEDPEGWLRTVALRRLSNRDRGARRLARHLLRSGPPAAVPEPTADRVDVERALACLPAPQRTVVVLHHLLGLEVEQIARELNLPIGTVKSRLSRGRAALVPLLSDLRTERA